MNRQIDLITRVVRRDLTIGIAPRCSGEPAQPANYQAAKPVRTREVRPIGVRAVGPNQSLRAQQLVGGSERPIRFHAELGALFVNSRQYLLFDILETRVFSY